MEKLRDVDTHLQILVALPADDAARLKEIGQKTRSARVALIREAVKGFLAERSGRRLAVELTEDLRLDLSALQEAMEGASLERMVARALHQYIEKQVKDNDGIAADFEKARKALKSRKENILEFPIVAS